MAGSTLQLNFNSYSELDILRTKKRVAPNKSEQVFVKPVNCKICAPFLPLSSQDLFNHGCIVHSGRNRVTPWDRLLPAGDPSSKPSMYVSEF